MGNTPSRSRGGNRGSRVPSSGSIGSYTTPSHIQDNDLNDNDTRIDHEDLATPPNSQYPSGHERLRRRFSSIRNTFRSSTDRVDVTQKDRTDAATSSEPGRSQQATRQNRRSLRLRDAFRSVSRNSFLPSEDVTELSRPSAETLPPILPPVETTVHEDMEVYSDQPGPSTPTTNHVVVPEAPGRSFLLEADPPAIELLEARLEPDNGESEHATGSYTPTGGELVSPMPGEDQAAMLSRLLSVAAAATAASLVGTNNSEALRDAREVAAANAPAQPQVTSNNEVSDLVDGSFDGFLAALQSGHLAQALRNGGNVMGGGVQDLTPQQPLNFFRMFRFSSPVVINGAPLPVEDEGQMVPIIIVGIRSVPVRDDGTMDRSAVPPFLDSLRGVENFDDEDDALSQGLSEPSEEPLVNTLASSSEQANTSEPNLERRNGGIMDTVMDRLRSLRSDNVEEGSDRNRRRRRHTWRPFSSSERASTPPQNSQSRSWIIYVLGGTYPANHPILTTPSLFTDTPTYEDMALLSNIIGPAKPETASRDDLHNAGAVYDLGPEAPELQERCLICIADYQQGDTCRRLKKCSHYFHQSCIDEWLTTGRNSCPCCREKTDARTTAVAGLASPEAPPIS
ncbi:hypothetical protein MRB53_039061 [Persea americana]|nr:hypothetical protein MRB53_039061 [Persea americana]